MFSRSIAPVCAAFVALGSWSLAQAPKPVGPANPPVAARGIVVGAPGANSLNLRTSTGILIVKAHSMAQLKTVRGGDLVRVYGRPSGRFLTGANIRVLQRKASDNAEDYAGPRVEKVGGNSARATQTPAPARAR